MSVSTVTKTQMSAAASTIFAISEAIRELGEVPSGHLYAQVMGYLDLGQYNTIIGILTLAELITEKNHLLTWIGPKNGPK